MPDVFSLYPQAQTSQQPSLINNPSGIMQLVGQSRQLAGQQALGNAIQQGIGSDGQINPDVIAGALKNDPNAIYAAPEGLSAVLDARAKNIANSTSQFKLTAGQNDYVRNAIGALANNPNVTMDDVYGVAANLARSGAVSPEILHSTIAGLPTDPKGLRRAIGNINTSALGVAAASGRIQTSPDASGAPQTTSVAAAGYGSPTTQTGMAPGVSEALAAPQAEYVKDQSRSAQIMSNVRPLQQALPLIQQLSNANFGPGSPELAKIKGALITAGIINPQTSDLQVRQEANKYLLKYAAGASAAGRSDSALSAAIGSNPNLDLTQPANLGLIKNQIAMDRQDAVIPNSFKSANPDLTANPSKIQGYLDHKANFYSSTDPRAFAFDLMTPQERADLQKTLGAKDSPAYQKFIKSYNIAKSAGILTPEQAPANGQ